MDEPPAEPWFTYTEAAERLGWRLGKLKSKARREGWPVRQRNRGPHQVRLPDELLVQPRADHGLTSSATTVEPLEAPRVNHGHTNGAATVEPVAELRERLGRTEGELAGLRVALEHVTAERDRLLTELVQARKGWLERLLEAVRRR
jgi:hypothetical protein